MAPNRQQIQQDLKSFRFRDMFVNELGWDVVREPAFSVPVKGGGTFTLQPLVEKRGVKVLACSPGGTGAIPDSNVLRAIDREVTRYAREHIIVYVDAARTEQLWQWVQRDPGKPVVYHHHRFYPATQNGDVLADRLQKLNIDIDEEPTLTTPDVVKRLPSTFEAERVTKKFYDRFEKEHDRFITFIDGITEKGDKQWYTSLMLNRLMFIYFIQKQGFLDTKRDDRLDGDADYLRKRLTKMQTEFAGDSFYSFYRYFLLKLFHDSLSKREHAPALDRLLGRVPYLNGGLFDVHVLEANYPTIQIPDEAFVNIFNFFDEFNWYLDDRPLRGDKEINPDVLGYIFEKYINRKQMGAYYTKEDITGYISKNTIIPYIFDRTRDKNVAAFDADALIWPLLRDNPNRYFYDAARHGCDLPLPDDIAAGVRNVAQRGGWNRPAPEQYALPTETWGEVVARRQRYEEIRGKLAAGEVTSINDFVTYNLDICTFAQEVIENCEDTQLLRTFYESIESVTVLDPTCGSGAFLFAALNILEPLYAACLTRMKAMVEDEKQLGHIRFATKNFSPILERVNQHHNPSYFILKSIILNNLYGVDIMEEAVEICKLRLFLKLASQVEQYNHIEPLPDIDFNIRAGNTLIGFATYADAERVISSDLFYNVMERIRRQAEDVERSFAAFRTMQTELAIPSADMATMKAEIREKLKPLNDELNRYLASQYGKDRNSIPQKEQYEKEFAAWQRTHQPFHWFVEFYGIMRTGGFDVIIGNPPYVEYSKVRGTYTIKDYQTESCGNLYAYALERSYQLQDTQGRFGMIIPHSAFCTDRMEPIMNLCEKTCSGLWISTYSIRPSKLFVGADQRLAIIVSEIGEKKPKTYSTQYHCWKEEARDTLFNSLEYEDVTPVEFPNSIAKIHSTVEMCIWQRLTTFKPISTYLKRTGTSIYFHNAPRYWIRAMTFAPYFWNERVGEQLSTQVKVLTLSDETDANVVSSVINSNLFFWWFIVLSDCRHLNMREIERFPLGLDTMCEEHKKALVEIGQRLMEDYRLHAVRKETFYKTTGKVIYDEFYPKHSKPIIDAIDRVLARHYGFTDEELDFIINYDIKYRMGRDGAGDGGEDEEG
ncbi:MAG: Eco57I restriction-modification methylase domain-containing protein [Ktedonobacteraceae bacterium]